MMNCGIATLNLEPHALEGLYTHAVHWSFTIYITAKFTYEQYATINQTNAGGHYSSSYNMLYIYMYMWELKECWLDCTPRR